MTHQYGTVKGYTILNETTAGDETWVFLQMRHPYSPPNVCFDQNLLPTNLMVIVAWDVQGGFNVMPCKRWNGMHGITCYFCITTSMVQVGRNVQNWLNITSSYMIKVLPSEQMLLRMLSNIRGGVFYNLPFVLSLYHVTMISFPE